MSPVKDRSRRRVAAPSHPASVPPIGYTAEDAALLGAMQEVEIAARDLYQAALDAGADDDVYRGIRDNHGAYVDILSGLIGRSAGSLRNDALYQEHVGSFEESSGEALAQAAYDFESTLVATHTQALGELVGINGAAAVASIVMVEARHCTVLADMAGHGQDYSALFENTAEPLDLRTGAQG